MTATETQTLVSVPSFTLPNKVCMFLWNAFFLASFFNMKSLSNFIFKTKSNGIVFDTDFIFKIML